jgi:hypothetical protein
VNPPADGEALGVVVLALLGLIASLAAADCFRGTRSWRDWWDSLR